MYRCTLASLRKPWPSLVDDQHLVRVLASFPAAAAPISLAEAVDRAVIARRNSSLAMSGGIRSKP